MVARVTAVNVILTLTLMLTEAQNCGRCVHGTCSSAVCVCNAGYEGSACNTNVNDCYGTTACGPHGKCIDGIESFTCLCKTGYEGAFCTIHTGCKMNRCENGGTCSPDPDYPEEHVCTCAPGYSGRHCEFAGQGNTNLAYTKLAGVWGSSDGWSGRHEYAVDNVITSTHGGTNGTYCTHTSDGDYNPFLEVILDTAYPIKTVTVFNRIDGGQGYRFKNITVYVDGQVCSTWNQPDSTMYYREIIDMYCPDNMKGSTVRIVRGNGAPLTVCELQLFAGFVQH